MGSKIITMRLILIFLLFSFRLCAQSPNIIFIAADDLGYGDISRNDTMHYTPIIDSMANNAAYFDYAYAQPACTPTRAEWLTGKYAFRTGMHVSTILRYEERHLPLEEKLLPEYLQDMGYMTGMVGKWHLGHAQPEHYPDARGFEWTSAISGYGAMEYFSYESDSGFESDGGIDLVINGQPDSAIGTNQYLTFLHGDRCVDFIQKNAISGNPFFLYASFFAPHISDNSTIKNEIPTDSLTIAPTAGRDSLQRKKYVMLKMLDNQVKRIWDEVIAQGIEDNTIIIFYSDNGGDTNYGSSNGTLTGKKGDITEGGMRIPMFWYHKNTVAAQVIDTMIFPVDILPSIISAAGGTPPGGIDGSDITPLLDSGTIPTRTMIGAYIPGKLYALYRAGFKLCNNCDETIIGQNPVAEDLTMYNIRTDPTESIDVIGSNTALRDTMQEVLDGETAQDRTTTGAIVNSPPGGWAQVYFWGTVYQFANPNYYYYKY